MGSDRVEPCKQTLSTFLVLVDNYRKSEQKIRENEVDSLYEIANRCAPDQTEHDPAGRDAIQYAFKQYFELPEATPDKALKIRGVIGTRFPEDHPALDEGFYDQMGGNLCISSGAISVETPFCENPDELTETDCLSINWDDQNLGQTYLEMAAEIGQTSGDRGNWRILRENPSLKESFDLIASNLRLPYVVELGLENTVDRNAHVDEVTHAIYDVLDLLIAARDISEESKKAYGDRIRLLMAGDGGVYDKLGSSPLSASRLAYKGTFNSSYQTYLNSTRGVWSITGDKMVDYMHGGWFGMIHSMAASIATFYLASKTIAFAGSLVGLVAAPVVARGALIVAGVAVVGGLGILVWKRIEAGDEFEKNHGKKVVRLIPEPD